MLNDIGDFVGEQVKEYGQHMAAGQVESQLVKSGMHPMLAGFIGLGALVLFIFLF